METFNDGAWTYLNLKQGGRVLNHIAFIIAKPGWGKSLCGAGFVDQLHREGYVVISLADPKDEIELGYAMFEPEEAYHKNHLYKINKTPERKSVKLYHPFTFSLPTKDLPEIKFFTIPIKTLTKKELSILIETESDTETIRLISNVIQDFPESHGSFELVHAISDLVRSKKTKRGYSANPKNWFLEAPAGNIKSVGDIGSIFKPFQRHWFLSPNNSVFNLDWKEILSDQKNYHVFFTRFIDDEKVKDFVVEYLFNQIIRNRNYLKYPVVFFIPELAKLVPYKQEGHKIYLASSMKDNLGTMRSIGVGMSAVLDTQDVSGVDTDVINKATDTFIGSISGANEIDRLTKAYSFGSAMKKQILELENRGTFFRVGDESDAWALFYPCHMWKEERYNFFEMYKKHYPEKMKNYSDLINMMKKEYVNEEEKYREKTKRKIKEEKEAEEKRAREKEEKKSGNKDLEKKVEKAKDIQDKSKVELMRLIWTMKQENPELSARGLAKKFSIGRDKPVHHATVKKYLKIYEEDILKLDKTKEPEKNSEEVSLE